MILSIDHFRAVRLAIVIAALALGACSPLAWQPLDTQLTQLCDEHRYATALATLDARGQHRPDYAQKRAAILSEAKRHEAELLKQAEALVQQQQFSKAQVLIDAARTELPTPAALTQFETEARAARTRYLQLRLDELVPMRAATLAKEHRIYQAIATAAVAPELQQALARHEAEIDYFVPLIVDAANQAVMQNNYAEAAHYFAIANQLRPSPELAQRLKSAENLGSVRRQKQKHTRSSEVEQRYQELRDGWEKALRSGEFIVARDLLDQARELTTHGEEIELMQRDLDNASADYIATQVDAGNRQYADGNIEDALRSWRSANALMPTPDLQEKIGKAERFLERLRQLQKPAG